MFTVENQISGKAFSVSDDVSILDAAISSGINFPYGCQKGFCGQCKATIIEGEVGYDGDIPNAITAQEVNDGMALLCQCKAKTDIKLAVSELDSVTDIALKMLPCKAEFINKLNDDVVQLFLKIPGSESLQYLAGQYIDLIHPEFEPRAFSIANAPVNSSTIELHIRIVDDGKFTNYIFNELEEKSLLKIEGPKGSFYFREDSDMPIILVAGGTGFAPIKAIVEHMITVGIEREVFIYWGVRDEPDIYMSIPEKWSRIHKNIHFVPVLSEPNIKWNGRVGFVHESVLQDFEDLSKYEIYACGPPIMVESAANTFVKHGMKKDKFYSDAFEFAFEM
ncbi:MAG: CDP-6-deoxy-delta-3,4-glucoseen reductase [Candidatus Thioglobus sp.]